MLDHWNRVRFRLARGHRERHASRPEVVEHIQDAVVELRIEHARGVVNAIPLDQSRNDVGPDQRRESVGERRPDQGPLGAFVQAG